MNSFVVIDASFTLRAVLANPLAEKARNKLGEWDRDSLRLRSPGLWYYEVASALSKLVRFKELSWEQARTAMKLALDLQVELVTPDGTDYRAVWQWTEQLQRAASYDSFYLAVAEQANADLWTADKRLYNAVAQPWVHLLSGEMKA